MHGLFVRQAKNYLIKFGWCYHPLKVNGKPNKSLLCLTNLGKQVNECGNIRCVRSLYSDYFYSYSFNGLLIIPFVKQLLQALEYVDIDEFNYFVVHAYSHDELDAIIGLIKIYRSLSTADKDAFYDKFKTHFNAVKEGTAKSVYGNYFKNVKHNVSAIAWCDGFSYAGNQLRLSR